MPFTVVRMPKFIALCKALNPSYVLPSIYRLKNNVLGNKREIGDEVFCEELKLNNYVTITIDGWSTRSLVSMMGMIVHYQPEIIPKANVLSIELFEGSHTSEKIAKFTLDICNYWQMTNKVVRIGSDNGANMIKAFASFSDRFPLDDVGLVVHDDSEGNTGLDEIHPSILLVAVDNIIQELAG